MVSILLTTSTVARSQSTCPLISPAFIEFTALKMWLDNHMLPLKSNGHARYELANEVAATARVATFITHVEAATNALAAQVLSAILVYKDRILAARKIRLLLIHHTAD